MEQIEFPDFPTVDRPFKELRFRPLNRPIWTENKAKLIERYLFYFVCVTHHGDYIDGFAGPQKPGEPTMWAAKLVLESEPKQLRKFFLCEKQRKGYRALEALKNDQTPVKGRDIYLYNGDFNENVHRIRASNLIGQKEATFCLLISVRLDHLEKLWQSRWSRRTLTIIGGQYLL
ncbi:MAG: three-Cys-motif partner protein TcmP [Candidatus Competibacteraceae bacterium]|nr:three-Cys-motif partner protein TcmP [Candidatus Competibacteraceae bacterium]